MLNLIKTHFQDYVNFLKKPDPNPRHKKISSGAKWKSLLIFILIDFLLVIPATLLIFLIQEAGNLDLDDHALTDLVNGFSLINLILLVGIISPFIEEIIFRLPLNYKRNYLLKLIGKIVGSRKVKTFWFRYYTIFFYLFIIAFSVVHIFNYRDESIGILLLTPILVLPQIIGGTIMAYLRLKLGFFWGFAQHAIFNSALIIVAFYTNIEEKVMIDNQDFKLIIEVAENRFAHEKTVEINSDFDFLTEIETEYAQFNQIARGLDWETVDEKQNSKLFNIEFRIKNLEIDSDSVLQHHLKEIIED